MKRNVIIFHTTDRGACSWVRFRFMVGLLETNVGGEVASKKNHRQLVQVKGRGAVLLPSKRYREWDKEAKRVILAYGRPQRPFASARLQIAIYHGDAVRRDTNNATQGIQDVLVEMGVIEDDNWMVIGSPEVLHFVDVADPRMEVTVTETEPVDYKAVFKAARKELNKNRVL